mmetsp:Transcript_34995/g.96767  ORF Transcript_34995/g.96767 Transcript_34995/m.96767 type:complete len:286 (+) Transcript_34995:1424-2281(+)
MSPSISKKSCPWSRVLVQRPSKRPAARSTQTSPLPHCSTEPTSSAVLSGASGSVVVNFVPLTLAILLVAPQSTVRVSPKILKTFSPGFSLPVHHPSKGPSVGIQTSPFVQWILLSLSSPASCCFQPCNPVVNLLSPCVKRPNSMSSTKCSESPTMTKMSKPELPSSIQRPSNFPQMWASTMKVCSGPAVALLANTSMPLTPRKSPVLTASRKTASPVRMGSESAPPTFVILKAWLAPQSPSAMELAFEGSMHLAEWPRKRTESPDSTASPSLPPILSTVNCCQRP